MARVKVGDLVEINAGKYRGQRGVISRIVVKAQRCVIKDVTEVVRHLKPNKDKNHPEGGVHKSEGTIHLSNVNPICPQTDKPTRVAYKVGDDGKKLRIARVSGASLK